MAVLYEHDFSEVANGTNLTAVTPTVGSALVKHPDAAANLIVQDGLLGADGAAEYITQVAANDSNIALDALLSITSVSPSTFTSSFLHTQHDPTAGQAGVGYSSLQPWFQQRAGIYNNSSVDNTVDEIVWPNGEEVWVRYEQQGNWLRVFVNGCEAMRRYISGTPLTSYRLGVGTQNASSGDNFVKFRTLRMETGESTRKQVTWYGDSLTRGQILGGYAPFFQTAPSLLADALGGGESVDVVNMGRPGAAIANIVQYATETVGSSASPDDFRFGGRLTHRPSASNFAIVWTLTNDVLLTGYSVPQTAAQMVAAVEDFCDDLRADGVEKILAIGITHSEHPDYGNPHTPTYNATVDDVNSLLSESSHVDSFLNLMDYAEFQDSEDTDWFADKLHLTLAGYARVADLVYDIVNPWVNPVTVNLNGFSFPLFEAVR